MLTKHQPRSNRRRRGQGMRKVHGQDAPVHRTTSYRCGRRMIGNNESRFSEKTVPH
jgi:hypothetical protein